MIKYIILFIGSVLISSISQVLLKKSTGKKYTNRVKEYFNRYVFTAYALFFLASLVTVFAYKRIPLSLGLVLEATGYVFVAVLSYIFLKEKIKKQKVLGLGIIIIGVFISSFWEISL